MGRKWRTRQPPAFAGAWLARHLTGHYHLPVKRWGGRVLKAFLLVGMPIYLLLAEQGVKFLLAEPLSITSSGASIAVAGLSLTIPAIIPRRVPVVMSEAVRASFAFQNIDATKLRFHSRRDDRVIEAALIAFLIIAAVWCWTLYLVHTQHFYLALVIGAGCYALGVAITWWKEAEG